MHHAELDMPDFAHSWMPVAGRQTPSPNRRVAVALPVRLSESLHGSSPIRHVNTSHLRKFVLLMQYGSAITAERHSGTKSACILYAIRRLEDVLHTPLFVRDAAVMHPTAAAQRLLPCAVRLLSMWDDLMADRRKSRVAR